MRKKVLIYGNHPLRENLLAQYGQKDCDTTVVDSVDASIDIDSFAEVCILPKAPLSFQNKTQIDQETLSVLREIGQLYHPAQHQGKRLKCHLLLTDNTTLQILRIQDFSSAVKASLDVYPFTMEDEWSRTIILDRQPITIQSEKIVHLVIFGKGQMAERVAVNAAHVAHYPNYTRNHRLRTRITIICEQMEAWRDAFIQKYQHLFDHSFYRFISPSHHLSPITHHPLYHQREDFVDVEWEFVEATCYTQAVKDKLQLWSSSKEKQLLTVVFAHEEQEQNIQEAFMLPASVSQNNIPVYVYTKDSILFQNISLQGKAATMKPFGMLNSGYDIRQPLVEMAKTVNAIYRHCYTDDVKEGDYNLTMAVRFLKYAVEITHEERERLWEELPMVKRMSSISNAMNIATKMRSVGIMENEWERFYDLSSEEIGLLAQVEHNRWCVEELMMGWRPCTDEERKMVEEDINQKQFLKRQKIHYDLCSFNELGFDETGKHVALYDLCLCASLPFIAKSAANDDHQEGGWS